MDACLTDVCVSTLTDDIKLARLSIAVSLESEYYQQPKTETDANKDAASVCYVR